MTKYVNGYTICRHWINHRNHHWFLCIETFYDEVFKEEPTDQWRDDSSTDDADGQKAFSKADQSNDEINGKVYVKGSMSSSVGETKN